MGLHEHILTDPVIEMELRELIPCRPDQTVATAVDTMKLSRLGCVVVIDDAGKPIGKFTERHLMKIIDQPKTLDDPLEKHMTPCQSIVNQNEPVQKLIDIMRDRDSRFVCVVDDAGKAVALTGAKGVLEYVTEHFPRVVKVQMMQGKLFFDQREGA